MDRFCIRLRVLEPREVGPPIRHHRRTLHNRRSIAAIHCVTTVSHRTFRLAPIRAASRPPRKIQTLGKRRPKRGPPVVRVAVKSETVALRREMVAELRHAVDHNGLRGMTITPERHHSTRTDDRQVDHRRNVTISRKAHGRRAVLHGQTRRRIR